MLFRKGLPIKALGAGKHHIFLDHSQVVSVDTRSVKVSFKYTSLSKDKKFIDYEVIAMARVDQPIAYIMNSGQNIISIVESGLKLALRDGFLEHDQDKVYSDRRNIEQSLLIQLNRQVEKTAFK